MSVVLPIEEDTRYRIYTASAGQAAFSVPFPFQDNDDIKAYLGDEDGWTIISASLYTVSGAGMPGGGTLTFLAGRAVGEKILIVGEAVLERLTSIALNGRFSSGSTDRELDRNRIIQQEQARDLNRAIKTDFGQESVTLSGDLTDGDTLMKLGNRLVKGPNAESILSAEGFAQSASDSSLAAANAAIAALAANTSALAAANAALAAANAGFVFNTRNQAQSATIPPTIGFVSVEGRTAIGAGGKSAYRKVGLSEPAHAGKFLSGSDWFEAYGINPDIDTPALYRTGVYSEAADEGRAQHLLTSRHELDLIGKERYNTFIGVYDAGTGDGTVPASTYGLGISALKKDWATSTRQGQMHGLSIVTRGGFHGVNPVPGSFYNPGDTAGIVINSLVSSDQSFVAALEGISVYAKNGAYAFDAVDPVRQIRFQIGAIRAVDNPGIGLLLAGESGNLGAAIQVQNRIDLAIGAGSWSKAFAYVANFGSGFYEPLAFNQLGDIVMNNGPAASAPNNKKTIRVGTTGRLEVVNSAGTAVVLGVGDTGVLNLVSTGRLSINETQVVGPRRTGWTFPVGVFTRTSFDTQTVTVTQLAQRVAALLEDLAQHGLVGG